MLSGFQGKFPIYVCKALANSQWFLLGHCPCQLVSVTSLRTPGRQFWKFTTCSIWTLISDSDRFSVKWNVCNLMNGQGWGVCVSTVFNYLYVNSRLFIRQFLTTMILELQHFLIRLSWKVLHLRIALGDGRGRRSKLFFRITGAHLMGGKNNQAWTLSKGKLLFLHLQLLKFCAYCKWNVLPLVGWSTFCYYRFMK